MQDIIINENIKIENLIYEIRGKQVMLDSEISVPKCHYYLYDKIIIHYYNVEAISVLSNCADIICTICKGEIW